MLENLIYAVLALGLSYVIGLVQNKPGYTKFKAVSAAVSKGLADDKLTKEELKEIVDGVK